MEKTEKSIRKYCSRVRRHLLCSKSTFNNWEKGYRDELLDRFSEQCDLSCDELEHELGKPKDMANQIQDNISPEESAVAIKRRKLRVIVIIPFLVVVICVMIYGYQRHSPVKVTDTIIVDKRF